VAEQVSMQRKLIGIGLGKPSRKKMRFVRFEKASICRNDAKKMRKMRGSAMKWNCVRKMGRNANRISFRAGGNMWFCWTKMGVGVKCVRYPNY